MKRVIVVIFLCGVAMGAGYALRALSSAPPVRAQSGCTNANFQGAFGYTFRGSVSVNSILAPYAAAGRLVADGNGKFTGAESASVNGDIVRRVYNGVYAMNPNCSGTAILNDNFGAVNNFDFIIVNGGKRVDFVQTDPGTALTGTLNPL